MILEGLVTTLNSDGSTRISPMGPEVDASLSRWVLRPYQGSNTLENLRRTGEGVFHITDDVELLARAAIGDLASPPALLHDPRVAVPILRDACRWFAFRVTAIDESQARARIDVELTCQASQREFLGFNRARHAVVEAAILATRVGILPHEQIAAELDRQRVLVDKTGGPAERRAFELLCHYIQAARDRVAPPAEECAR